MTGDHRSHHHPVTSWNLKMALGVFWFLVFLVPSSQGALVYEEYNNTILGHTRITDGSFEFGGLPEDEDEPTEVTKEEMMVLFGFFSDFAKAIVDSIQTQSFPYDLLRRMMYNSYDPSEIMAYQTNIIMTCAITACIITAIVVVMIVYTVLHWRNRKHNRHILKKQLFDQKTGRKIIICGFILCILNFMFLMLSLVTSTSTMTAVKDLDSGITGAMDGVSGYFNHSGEQWDYMSNDTNVWALLTVMQNDVNDIGSLIWQPAVQQYSATLASPFTDTSNLDDELAQAAAYLEDMQNQINTIVSGSVGQNLTAVMNEIYYNLTFARSDMTCNGCDGSCTDCYDVVVNDIYYNMDFTTLTNVTSHITALQALMGTVIADSLISPEYYFWKGIGDVIETNADVAGGMANLNATLEAYSASISQSTDGIITPDEDVLKFDRFRSEWSTFYESASGQGMAYYAFHLIFGMINIGMLMVLYVGWALLVLPGLIKVKAEDDNFKLPRRIIMVCLIIGVGLSVALGSLSIAGFYAGASVEKAVCENARDLNTVNKTVDYYGAIPGHDGWYLSSILLGNGSTYPLFAEDIIGVCRANNTTSYETFHQDLIVPNIYSDLEYPPFFANVSEYFDVMYISLSNVTLVPPELETWHTEFYNAAFFNLTEYVEFLANGAINAVLTDFTTNLETIYLQAYPDGPLEPAKSRLIQVAQSLLANEAALNEMTALKDNVTTTFENYKALIESMESKVTGAISDLWALNSDIQSRSAGYIASGVNLHRVNFLAQLQQVEDISKAWVTEVGPCAPLAFSYDMAVDAFCNKFADNMNATWLLVGHTVFFLLFLSLTSFFLFREIPQGGDDDLDEGLDIKKEFPKMFGYRSSSCCVCCTKSSQKRARQYRAQTPRNDGPASSPPRQATPKGIAPMGTAPIGKAPMGTKYAR